VLIAVKRKLSALTARAPSDGVCETGSPRLNVLVDLFKPTAGPQRSPIGAYSGVVTISLSRYAVLIEVPDSAQPVIVWQAGVTIHGQLGDQRSHVVEVIDSLTTAFGAAYYGAGNP